MSRDALSIFDHPFFLGFDRFEENFDRLRKNINNGYPPYNIEQRANDIIRITVAVAGFSIDDLTIELENNQLTIFGKIIDKTERVFLHRGIATRQFQRSFILADGVEIKEATLDNGLLHIDLETVIPEKSVRRIKIKSS